MAGWGGGGGVKLYSYQTERYLRLTLGCVGVLTTRHRDKDTSIISIDRLGCIFYPSRPIETPLR